MVHMYMDERGSTKLPWELYWRVLVSATLTEAFEGDTHLRGSTDFWEIWYCSDCIEAVLSVLLKACAGV